jgi:signal transduction histidine kinase
VILVSADVEISMAIRAMKNGALGVLEKPYEADDLSDLVYEAMDHSARMRHEQSEKADERDQALLVYDLHDGVAQYLAMGITLLEQCGPLPTRPNGETGATFEDAMRLLRRAMAELRNIISGTHLAAGTENIAGMLEEVLADFHDRLEIELIHDPKLAHLDTELVRALYCIVRELLTNAWRHSQSRKVRIDVERNDGKLHIHCKDWGIGFDPANVARGRFGLQGIRGRARLLGGTTTVRSSAGEGTCVSVCLPLIRRMSPVPGAAVACNGGACTASIGGIAEERANGKLKGQKQAMKGVGK